MKNLIFGRLAQLVAHHIDMVEVAGSSPVSPTIKEDDTKSSSFNFKHAEVAKW